MPTPMIKPLKLTPMREERRPSSTSGRPVLAVVRHIGGKVVHDSRGNAMWDWAVATGVLAGTKAAELLRMLDNPTLALEGECELVGEWAGDPYNRS